MTCVLSASGCLHVIIAITKMSSYSVNVTSKCYITGMRELIKEKKPLLWGPNFFSRGSCFPLAGPA